MSLSGELIARAPRWMPKGIIEAYIRAKWSWIEKSQKKIMDYTAWVMNYEKTDITQMKRVLEEYLEKRVHTLWKSASLPWYTSLKVTTSERRWWSCSGKNGLCFSYRLTPYITENPAFIDAIIYHELAHLHEKNHGKNFWKLVYSMMPEYEKIMKDHTNKKKTSH